MKLVKSEVEEVTKEALDVVKISLAALRMAGCPYPDWYSYIENFAAKLDKHRESLGLEPIVDKVILEKLFSTKIAEQAAEMKANGGLSEGLGGSFELTPEQARQVQALLESFKGKKSAKKQIGFSLEDLEYDPKKVN